MSLQFPQTHVLVSAALFYWHQLHAIESTASIEQYLLDLPCFACSYQRNPSTDLNSMSLRAPSRLNSVPGEYGVSRDGISGNGLSIGMGFTLSRASSQTKCISKKSTGLTWSCQRHWSTETGSTPLRAQSNERYLERPVGPTCSYQRLHTPKIYNVPLRALNQTCNPVFVPLRTARLKITNNSFRYTLTACA